MNPSARTSLDYAREILETGLRMLAEVNTDPRYYAEVAPHVNDAMANFLAAEQAEGGTQVSDRVCTRAPIPRISSYIHSRLWLHRSPAAQC